MDEFKNLIAARFQIAALIVLTALAGAGVMIFTHADSRTAFHQWQAAVQKGEFALKISSVGGVTLEAGVCDSLNSVDGVRAAGGVIAVERIRIPTQPSLNYTLFEVTPGYIQAMWPGFVPSAGTLTIGIDAAERLGVGPGKWLLFRAVRSSTVDVSAQVGEIPPSSPRDQRLDRALVATVPAVGQVRDCIVDLAPGQYKAARLAIEASIPLGLIVTDLDAGNDAEQATALLQDRLSRAGWLGFAVLIVGMNALVWHSRRTDFALYVLLGADRARVVAMLALDAIAHGFFALQIGALGALIYVEALGADELTARLLFWDYARMTASVMFLPIIGYLVVRPARTIDTLKGS